MDRDCDPTTIGAADVDLDGRASLTCGGDDCDDSVPSVNPTGTEICNGVDDDCDFSVDEGLDGCMP